IVNSFLKVFFKKLLFNFSLNLSDFFILPSQPLYVKHFFEKFF
ncbi:hypothetical protein D922_00988, partial [Enterococcus faecalis 06-MB-DW-09]